MSVTGITGSSDPGRDRSGRTRRRALCFGRSLWQVVDRGVIRIYLYFDDVDDIWNVIMILILINFYHYYYIYYLLLVVVVLLLLLLFNKCFC